MKQKPKSKEQRFKERQERKQTDLLIIKAFAEAVKNLEESVWGRSTHRSEWK